MCRFFRGNNNLHQRQADGQQAKGCCKDFHKVPHFVYPYIHAPSPRWGRLRGDNRLPRALCMVESVARVLDIDFFK